MYICYIYNIYTYTYTYVIYTYIYIYMYIYIYIYMGPGVAQWFRRCATSRKVPGSIFRGFMGFFSDIFLPTASWPWVRLSP